MRKRSERTRLDRTTGGNWRGRGKETKRNQARGEEERRETEALYHQPSIPSSAESGVRIYSKPTRITREPKLAPPFPLEGGAENTLARQTGEKKTYTEKKRPLLTLGFLVGFLPPARCRAITKAAGVLRPITGRGAGGSSVSRPEHGPMAEVEWRAGDGDGRLAAYCDASVVVCLGFLRICPAFFRHGNALLFSFQQER